MSEMPAAVHAQHPARPCGPVVHDGLEIGNIGRGQESVDDGLVVVVAADEIVQTSVETVRVVIEAWRGKFG